MLRRHFTTFLPFLTALLLTLAVAACGDDHEHGAATHTHGEEEAHEHGAATHTHEATAADTAGTYVDTTGAFFEADDEPEAEGEAADHEHGPDTHTHE